MCNNRITGIISIVIIVVKLLIIIILILFRLEVSVADTASNEMLKMVILRKGRNLVIQFEIGHHLRDFRY